MNIIDAFKLPHSNNEQVTTKIASYTKLLDQAVKSKDTKLAEICTENVNWLNTLLTK